jgi:hypothetical protein
MCGMETKRARSPKELYEELVTWPECGGFQIDRLAEVLAEFEARLVALEDDGARLRSAALDLLAQEDRFVRESGVALEDGVSAAVENLRVAVSKHPITPRS